MKEKRAYTKIVCRSGPPKIFKEPYRRMLHSPQSTYEDDTKRMSNWLRPAPWAYQSSIRYHVMQLQRGASQCSAHDISTPPSINRIVESAVYTNVHNIFLQPFQVEHILSEIEKHTKQGQIFVERLQGKTGDSALYTNLIQLTFTLLQSLLEELLAHH